MVLSSALVVKAPLNSLRGLSCCRVRSQSLKQRFFDLTRQKLITSGFLSIPGIGRILALTILYEIGEISRFKDVRHFSSYCRLVPGVAQSGAVSRRGRASKQGNHYLKSAFNQAAVAAVRSYPADKADAMNDIYSVIVAALASS